MANEIIYSSVFKVTKGNNRYQRPLASYQDDQSGVGGPTPGSFLATTGGTIVNLSELTVPGWCSIINYDADNFITVGVWLHDQGYFAPFMEIPAGKYAHLKLSRFLNQEFDFTGTGTGTTGELNELMVVADTANCEVSVEAFEA